jgi:hypothetical protein
MMLLDVFLEGLFEMDLRRINSEEVGGASALGQHAGLPAALQPAVLLGRPGSAAPGFWKPQHAPHGIAQPQQIGHAMNLVLEEANERIKNPLRKFGNPLLRPRVGGGGAALLICITCISTTRRHLSPPGWNAHTPAGQPHVIDHRPPPPPAACPPALQAQWTWSVSHAQRLLGSLYGRIHDTIRARGVPPEDETVLWACLARIKDPKTGAGEGRAAFAGL